MEKLVGKSRAQMRRVNDALIIKSDKSHVLFMHKNHNEY